MNRIWIKLDSMEKVKNFVNITGNFVGKIRLTSDGFSVDGKSIMGIYTLDLKNELIMDIETGDDSSELIHELRPYIIAGA